MLQRASLLLITLALAACALPLASQPAPTPPPPTVSRPTSTPAPTQMPDAPTGIPATQAPTAPPLLAALDAAQPQPRDQAALTRAFRQIPGIPEVARSTPLDVHVGDVETFWVLNPSEGSHYTITAQLRYAGPVALMYVDTAVDVEQEAVERAAREFEERIYPRNRALFGPEPNPGIDGDARLTILNTPLSGAAGYFSSTDAVVREVNRFSNEREMFVMGINHTTPGTPGYGSTLAHEFQHMIHAHRQPRSPAWMNEGMSTLAEDLNGYVDDGLPGRYLAAPDLQLTTWAGEPGPQLPHYGAAQLFLRYFYEQYAGEQGLDDVIEADAGNNPEALVPIAARKRADITSFADLYADWAVANVLNDPSVGDGRYAYTMLPGSAALSAIASGEAITTVHQFGVDYLGVLRGPLTLGFDGADSVGLTGARPLTGRAMWWSNRGDDSVSTLTRAFDLSGARQATLQFSIWHEIERNWDYAFVSVSTDGGATWSTLPGRTTTNDDALGHNFGNGLTGVSGAAGVDTDAGTRASWIEERMDLTPFAGKRILLRFWLVTDAVYNASGLLLDDIRIPEIGYHDGAEAGDGGWQTQGFARTSGELPQRWTLRLIRATSGSVRVEPVPLDSQGRATIELGEGEDGVLAVIGSTPFTTERASYSYTVD